MYFYNSSPKPKTIGRQEVDLWQTGSMQIRQQKHCACSGHGRALCKNHYALNERRERWIKKGGVRDEATRRVQGGDTENWKGGLAQQEVLLFLM